jgi:hypothetical protein
MSLIFFKCKNDILTLQYIKIFSAFVKAIKATIKQIEPLVIFPTYASKIKLLKNGGLLKAKN